MASTPAKQARAIGFLNPKIVQVRIRRGETFIAEGVTSNGFPYELRYEIMDYDRTSITLKMEGEVGKNATFSGITETYTLTPNHPVIISNNIYFGQTDIYIAFLAPTASEFRPKVGGELVLAFGDVRDTVPPPGPPPKR